MISCGPYIVGNSRPVSTRNAAHSISVAIRSKRGSGLSPSCVNHPKSWLVILPFRNPTLTQSSNPARSGHVSDTPNGNRHPFCAFALAIKGQPTFTKVVEPRGARIGFCCRPVESVLFQSGVLAIVWGEDATHHGIEPRVASA